MTYAKLDIAIDEMVASLTRSGISRGSLVAIRMAPSVTPVVAMLAALRHGCSYLPLDPHGPQERNQFILQ